MLLAGIAATFTLAAADLDGKWSGIMTRSYRTASISLDLYQDGQSVSGTATFDQNVAAKIENPQLTGNLLTFSVHDASGGVAQFRLRAVSGPLIGEVFHGGPALSGEAQFGDRVAQVVLPSQIGEGTTRPILLKSVPTEYSEEARKAKLQGTVHLSVLIDATGRPTEFHVLQPRNGPGRESDRSGEEMAVQAGAAGRQAGAARNNHRSELSLIVRPGRGAWCASASHGRVTVWSGGLRQTLPHCPATSRGSDPYATAAGIDFNSRTISPNKANEALKRRHIRNIPAVPARLAAAK